MLKEIVFPVETPEPEYGSDSPIVTCEACGKQGPSHLMINAIIAIGSPGHPSLPPFQCSGSEQFKGSTEHWACSPDCWASVAHACIDEHMAPLLNAYRSKVVTE